MSEGLWLCPNELFVKDFQVTKTGEGGNGLHELVNGVALSKKGHNHGAGRIATSGSWLIRIGAIKGEISLVDFSHQIAIGDE